jgi:hypothetical protein
MKVSVAVTVFPRNKSFPNICGQLFDWIEIFSSQIILGRTRDYLRIEQTKQQFKRDYSLVSD